jgi:hypothetical protein
VQRAAKSFHPQTADPPRADGRIGVPNLPFANSSGILPPDRTAHGTAYSVVAKSTEVLGIGHPLGEAGKDLLRAQQARVGKVEYRPQIGRIERRMLKSR